MVAKGVKKLALKQLRKTDFIDRLITEFFGITIKSLLAKSRKIEIDKELGCDKERGRCPLANDCTHLSIGTAFAENTNEHNLVRR
jgi:hypothetical protein